MAALRAELQVSFSLWLRQRGGNGSRGLVVLGNLNPECRHRRTGINATILSRGDRWLLSRRTIDLTLKISNAA